MRSKEHLAEARTAPLVGGTGDSHANALAESVVGLYKTEVIRRATGRGFNDVQYATLAWITRFNQQRLPEPLGYLPPAGLHDRRGPGAPGSQTPSTTGRSRRIGRCGSST
jgi:putative transposase